MLKGEQKRSLLTSSFGVVASLPFLLQGFLSTMTGDSCRAWSAPTCALDELALLVWSPLAVDTEHDVSLLSLEGEVTRLGRDLGLLCRLVSLRLFLACVTWDGMGLAVQLEFTAFPLRTGLIVSQEEPTTGDGGGKP